MSKVITGQAAGLEVCEALGLDPKLVRNIDIHFHLDDIVTATVETTVHVDHFPKIMKILKAYRWEAEE